MLAISLHATNDDLRNELVRSTSAIHRRAAGGGEGLSRPVQRRRVTFEYVMLKGVNDSRPRPRPWFACSRHPAKINLIPFNPGGQPLRLFGLVDDRGLRRGHQPGRLRVAHPHAARRDILAACGQLKSTVKRRGKRPSRQASDGQPSWRSSRCATAQGIRA